MKHLWHDASVVMPPHDRPCLVYTGHGEVVMASRNYWGGWTVYGLPLRERLRFRFFGRIRICGNYQRITILWWCLIEKPAKAL